MKHLTKSKLNFFIKNLKLTSSPYINNNQTAKFSFVPMT